MSHDIKLVDGLTYIQNLQNNIPLSQQSAQTIFFASAALLGVATGSSANQQALLNQYLGVFSETGVPLPTSLDNFINGFILYTTNLVPSQWSGSTLDQVKDGFGNDYRLGLGDPGNIPSTSDWMTIQPTPTVNEIKAQVDAFFADFASNYSYKPDKSVGTYTEFFAQMELNLTITAAITTGSELIRYTSPTSNYILTESFPRFQKIYDLFFPNGGLPGFQAKVSQFYHQQVAEKGYFIPSQLFEAFTQSVIKDATGGGSVAPGSDATTLAGMGAKKTLILDHIYAIIASLINTMQRVAAVQASRLTLLTQWQAAYTDELSKIHNFLAGDGTFLAGAYSDADRVNARNALNTQSNASIRDQLQSNRAIIGDDAKGLQSNVNQSNDAVSQQSNAATAIIQELNTILGAIFR